MQAKVKFEQNPALFQTIITAIENALNKAIIFVENEAIRRAPFKDGQLKGSISRIASGTQAAVFTNLEYAPFVEFGTKPHTITIRNKKVLSDRKSFFGKSVEHPGTKSQPFMRLALFGNKSEIEAIIAREMARRL